MPVLAGEGGDLPAYAAPGVTITTPTPESLRIDPGGSTGGPQASAVNPPQVPFVVQDTTPWGPGANVPAFEVPAGGGGAGVVEQVPAFAARAGLGGPPLEVRPFSNDPFPPGGAIAQVPLGAPYQPYTFNLSLAGGGRNSGRGAIATTPGPSRSAGVGGIARVLELAGGLIGHRRLPRHLEQRTPLTP